MRRTGIALAVAVALLLTQQSASAQGLEYKPIDTSKLVVQPTDTTTGILSGTTRYVSRVVASTIEENGFVKTINNLLGRRPAPKQTTQYGYSPLPLPSSYPSSSYRNSFTPTMPSQMVYGQSVPTTQRR
jgi:hypothetical protein